MLNVKKTLTKIMLRFVSMQNVITQTMTSNAIGHSAETTLTQIDLEEGTYLVVAKIYRSSVIAAAINRVLFRLYAGTTIIGDHDYKPGGSTNTTYINDTITTVVKLDTTTTIKLVGYCSHSADIGVDSANLYIVKLG